MEIWTDYVLPILSGLAVTIPLVIKLVEYVKKAIKERNWPGLLDLVIRYMEEAEKKFDNGADRKEWVMAMIEATADTVNYDVDMKVVSELIDGLCSMAKVVNVNNDVVSEVIVGDEQFNVAYTEETSSIQVTE